ncbi:hypothetical protein GCM10008931_43550 [Oceanobacillus oncorhynchi subsp. oncorhynchi]|uniref:DUF7167 family protein n=1 Tax=Oceanobacillus oncorhynchi TaxID=545501 RepID=UPI0031D8F765
MTKVKFTLGIGLVTCEHIEMFDIEEDLGLFQGEDYENKSQLDDLLEIEWKEWRNNHIDGGWHLTDE